MKEFESLACECGQTHTAFTSEVIAHCGAIKELPAKLQDLCCQKPFLVADRNTYKAAGEQITALLRNASLPYSLFIYEESPAPDEKAVGTAVMHFDSSCDCIVGIGSGVINDICKLLACTASLPYIIVATAPSMDGYASASSSMERHGVKVSLPTKCADVIIGDPDILVDAPTYLHLSGLGDMIAKYTSICEWRISSVINGEHYCERVAGMIRSALKKCIDNSEGLLKGDKDAVLSVFEGLVIAGAAMNYAGTSRPASGVEHYISHIWDMRALEFGTPHSTHGLQCAVGSVIAIGVYEYLKTHTPDPQKARAAFDKFNYADYKEQLKSLLGNGSRAMIALEKEKEHKYSRENFDKHLKAITENWSKLVEIMTEELSSQSELIELLNKLGAPTTVSALGISPENIGEIFEASRDIRDKYVLSRLIFDLGLTEDVKNALQKEYN